MSTLDPDLSLLVLATCQERSGTAAPLPGRALGSGGSCSGRGCGLPETGQRIFLRKLLGNISRARLVTAERGRRLRAPLAPLPLSLAVASRSLPASLSRSRGSSDSAAAGPGGLAGTGRACTTAEGRLPAQEETQTAGAPVRRTTGSRTSTGSRPSGTRRRRRDRSSPAPRSAPRQGRGRAPPSSQPFVPRGAP